MTKRYSDTLRKRAETRERAAAESWEPHKSLHIYGMAYGAALRDVANEIDDKFSGKAIYEQRNAALEELKRLKRRVAELERHLVHAILTRGDCDCAACLRVKEADNASREDG